MGSTMKKMTVILLLTAFLAPGLAQAQAWSWNKESVVTKSDASFMSLVWNLLSSFVAKTGGHLDPSGGTATGTTGTGATTDTTGTETTDNGGHLDPSGQP